MGRHRKPRRAGLPPLVSGVGIAAALATTLALVQPYGDSSTHLTLPAPTPAWSAPTSAPASTPAATTTLTPTVLPPPVVTVKAEPTKAPTTTKRPEPSPEPKPEKPADVAPEPEAKVQSSPKCQGLKVEPQVVKACEQIMAAVPGVTVVGGRAARPDNPTSCHPLGLALDLMTYKDMALGDRLYAYISEHKAALGVTTLLWRVADHRDHVHASVSPCKH